MASKVQSSGQEAKKCPKWVPVLVVAVLLIAGAVAAVLLVQHQNEVKQEQALQRQIQLAEDALQRVLLAIREDASDQLVFDDETKQALKAQGIERVFSSTVVRQAVAEKLAQQYSVGNFDATLELLTFLHKNHGLNFVVGSGGEAFDICFSNEYLSDLQSYIVEMAQSQEEGDTCTKYFYNDREFWFYDGSNIYIVWQYQQDGTTKEASVILGNTGFRQSHHTQYKQTSQGYFLVDEDVQLTMSQIEVVTGNCHRCSGTGKVTVSFGNRLNDQPGYEYGKRCGLCNGTGWK